MRDSLRKRSGKRRANRFLYPLLIFAGFAKKCEQT
jgi:hypothetical protein